jgi:hypothetical protein
VIGIIDGYFNQVPAVWHKEILWAISHGIQVFGAASMGALRAAELDTLGMTGCGEIYRAYQRGVLPPFDDEPFEDDDEVAVIHSPAELGYQAASDAMVNIRFSLAGALQQAIITETTCLKLAGIAKNLFYAKRNYAAILDIAIKQGLPEKQLGAFREWIKHHAIDQKQCDAITLLGQINSAANIGASATESPRPQFHHTSQWQSAMEEIDQAHHTENPTLNELRLQGEPYFEMLERALQSHPPQKDQPSLEPGEALTRLHTSPDKLRQLYNKYWQQKQTELTQDQQLLAYLERLGKLEALQTRAKDKRNSLMQLREMTDGTALNELEKLQLCDWYFTHLLGSEMPHPLESYVLKLGLNDNDAFYDMILAEYLFLKSKP